MNSKNLCRAGIILGFLFTSTLLSQTAIPPLAGEGSISSPYQISTIENIQWIAETPSVWKSAFVQTCDIDASVTKRWKRETGGGFYQTFSGLKPIGVDSAFCGTYDGNGYTIDSLFQYLENSTVTGLALFSQTSGATIKNLKITNAIVSSSYFTTSILVANASNSTISNCIVSGNVFGKIDVTGGLIGRSINSTISNCHSTAAISGGNGTGGLIGIMGKGSLEKSSCIASVKGVMETGGLVGKVGNGSIIRNCFHLGTVRAAYTVGGLFGVVYSNVTIGYCYNAGLTLNEGMFDTVGLSGSLDTVNLVFESVQWDATLACLPKRYEGSKSQGSTTSEMYQQATFTGWDFDSVWTIAQGIGYPQLRQNNGAMSSLPIQASYRVRPLTVVIQHNRLQIKEKTDCRITIVNLQGKNCISQQASELSLHELPNGKYFAIVQDVENAGDPSQKKLLPFTVSR